MPGSRAGAEILAHRHPSDDPLGRGVGELDAEEFRERQHFLLDPREHIHSIVLCGGQVGWPVVTTMVMPSLVG